MSETINYQVDGDSIATLSIDLKDRSMNVITRQFLEELTECVDKVVSDPAVKGAIITSGKTSFLAGADLKGVADLFAARDAEELFNNGMKFVALTRKMETGGKPFVAAMTGTALGGGLELAMACHMRVVSENAKLGLPEVSLGVIPGYGGTQRLAQLVGKGKAFEMIVTADMITAQDAYKWGLANYVTKQEDLLTKCFEITAKITTKSPTAIKTAIKVINAGYNNKLNGFEVEIEEFGKSFGTKDFKEGVGAFMDKRKPEFKGE